METKLARESEKVGDITGKQNTCQCLVVHKAESHAPADELPHSLTKSAMKISMSA